MNLFLSASNPNSINPTGGVSNIPVDRGLPDGIIETVEEVQEHRAHIARGGPVRGDKVRVGDGLARVALLPGVAASIDDHGEGEQDEQRRLGADGAAEVLEVEERSVGGGGDNLGKPVQEVVERLGAGVEVGGVDGILLVGVEPVGGPEHGEEQDDGGLGSHGLVETDELGLPAWVLHQDDLGAIGADDLARVAQEESQAGADEHEYDEGDVGAVRDGLVALDMDVLAEGNLFGQLVVSTSDELDIPDCQCKRQC